MRSLEEQIEHDRQMKGRIHSFETFGSVDGPGIRFVLFMQGCALRCKFCHNPDTWDMNTGNVYTVDDVIKQIEPYLPYYKNSGGGVTFSGGEPSLQAPFLAALARELKRRHDVHIALDSSGFFEASHLISSGLADAIDLVLLDLKIIDEKKHIDLTSQSNERILRTAKFYNEIGKAIWIRHVVIPSVTTDHEDVVLLGKEIAAMPMVQRVELLPYHEMGKYKWKQLNLPYELDHVSPPSSQMMKEVKQTLEEYIKVPVIY